MRACAIQPLCSSVQVFNDRCSGVDQQAVLGAMFNDFARNVPLASRFVLVDLVDDTLHHQIWLYLNLVRQRKHNTFGSGRFANTL